MRQINSAGLDLIKSCEGLRLEAYLPTVDDVWTIGYGHTHDVCRGDVIDEAQADIYLEWDLCWAENTVSAYAPSYVSDNQFAALVSICYNIGAANFKNSTLLRDLDKDDVSAASEQFLVWDKQRGTLLRGLEDRREKERALFDTPDGE
jgi:lysozyme